MRDTLQTLDDEFAFQTSGRFDLLAGEHVAYTTLGAPDVDGALRRSIERAEGVTTLARATDRSGQQRCSITRGASGGGHGAAQRGPLGERTNGPRMARSGDPRA